MFTHLPKLFVEYNKPYNVREIIIMALKWVS